MLQWSSCRHFITCQYSSILAVLQIHFMVFRSSHKSKLSICRPCISIISNETQEDIFLSTGGWNSYNMRQAAPEDAQKSKEITVSCLLKMIGSWSLSLKYVEEVEVLWADKDHPQQWSCLPPGMSDCLIGFSQFLSLQRLAIKRLLKYPGARISHGEVLFSPYKLCVCFECLSNQYPIPSHHNYIRSKYLR